MPDPVCPVIVFCDAVIVEQGTSKNTLIGTYASLGHNQFPFRVPRLVVHSIINFTPPEGGGAINFAVNMKHRDSGGTVASWSMPINLPVIPQKLPSGAINLNLNVPLQGLVFTAPAVYVCEVLLEGEVVGQRFLEVMHTQKPSPTVNPPPKEE